jgi:hypothetical protein
MKVCNEIKRRIDEADDTELFDLDIARHTAMCGDCQGFAGERAALRELIGSTARVSAPVNFDAMLKARLAEARTPRPPAWLNTMFYLRAGATTAALVIAVFVAQYSGLFTASPAKPSTAGESSTPSPTPSPAPSPAVQATGGDQAASATGHSQAMIAVSGGASRRSPSAYASSRRGVPLVTPAEARMGDSGAILIPGRNGEHDITVPTVSVGAQSLIYVNAGRQPQSARAVSVSF